MLKIKKEILQQLRDTFMSSNQEQGFLLGCKSHFERLEYCYQIPAVRAGKYFYIPNANEADKVIDLWAEQEICFCGFIHSHVVEKVDLSENDVEFAKQLFSAYKLPVLWFGLGLVQEEKIHFQFYSVQKNDNEDITIIPVHFVST